MCWCRWFRACATSDWSRSCCGDTSAVSSDRFLPRFRCSNSRRRAVSCASISCCRECVLLEMDDGSESCCESWALGYFEDFDETSDVVVSPPPSKSNVCRCGSSLGLFCVCGGACEEWIDGGECVLCSGSLCALNADCGGGSS